MYLTGPNTQELKHHPSPMSQGVVDLHGLNPYFAFCHHTPADSNISPPFVKPQTPLCCRSVNTSDLEVLPESATREIDLKDQPVGAEGI